MSWQRKEAVNQGGSFRTVSPGATTTVKVVAAGITYTATTTAWIKANTRYTIAFIADPVKPTVTIDNTNGPNWEHGETGTVPAGYDYYIYTKKDLEDWANDPTNLGKYAIQMANIEWDGTWTPIGGHTNLFTGVYNGNGHTITGLNIGTVDTYSGMFGRVSNNAVLTGIHLRGATININTAKHAGLLAGEAAGSTISLCSAQGKITHTDAREVGGLVGYTNNAHVTRCYADAIINTTTENLGRGRTGGLVGDSNNTYIIACGANTALSATYYSTEHFNFQQHAGGLVGDNHGNSYIYFCYATGTVNMNGNSTQRQAGGLIGYNSAATAYCYATANAAGSDGKTGTLVGQNHTGITIANCHAPKTPIVGEGDVDVTTTTNGVPKDVVRTNFTTPAVPTIHRDPITGYHDALNPISVTFYAPSVWTDADYPTINYNYNGGN